MSNKKKDKEGLWQRISRRYDVVATRRGFHDVEYHWSVSRLGFAFCSLAVVVLVAAAVVGFPVAYVCVKPWLEGYIHQVDIPLWLCPAIFVGVALLVALCIGWRVWRTAKAHPADEICKG